MTQESKQVPESEELQKRITRRKVWLSAIWAGLLATGTLEVLLGQAFEVPGSMTLVILCGIPFFGTMIVGLALTWHAIRTGDRGAILFGTFATLLSPFLLLLLHLLMPS